MVGQRQIWSVRKAALMFEKKVDSMVVLLGCEKGALLVMSEVVRKVAPMDTQMVALKVIKRAGRLESL